MAPRGEAPHVRQPRDARLIRPAASIASALLVVAAALPFTSERVVATGVLGARSVAAADIDGDGDLDAVAASQADGRVRWFENTSGNGSSWTARQIGALPTASWAVAADIDRDGDQDVIASSSSSDRIVWYQSNSNGSTWTERVISTAAQGAECVYVVDVDRDGDIDVLSASLDDDRIAWHENTAGNGSAWTMRTIATAADRAWFVTAADLDGDGDADAISGDLFGDKLAWYQNPGSATAAWIERTVSTANDDVRSVHAADLDGDGDHDLLAVGSANDRVVWYENAARLGTSWTEHVITTTLDGAHSVLAADVDVDGDLDVAATALIGDSVVWFENTAGNGTAWSATTLTRNVIEPSSIAAADVDRDCDPDLLVSAWNGNSVVWFQNQGTPSCEPTVRLLPWLIFATLLLLLAAFWKRVRNLVAGPVVPKPPGPGPA